MYSFVLFQTHYIIIVIRVLQTPGNIYLSMCVCVRAYVMYIRESVYNVMTLRVYNNLSRCDRATREPTVVDEFV